MPAWRLYDTHCHLSQMANAKDVAHEAADLGLAIFDCGVEPSEFPATCETLGGFSNVAVGAGLHPWWILSARRDVEQANAAGEQTELSDSLDAAADVAPNPGRVSNASSGIEPNDLAGEQMMLSSCSVAGEDAGFQPHQPPSARSSENQVRELVERARGSRYIGEVGLDFSAKHVHSREQQVHAFDELCKTLAEHPLPGRVLSIHAVQSAATVLDILEKYDLIGVQGAAAQNASAPAIIFHWFSGSGDELLRARKCGCYFSINEMMLKTKRGRAYAIQIPENQLLLETDAPPELGKPYSAQKLIDQLVRTLTTLADLRKANKEHLQQAITKTSAALLGI